MSGIHRRDREDPRLQVRLGHLQVRTPNWQYPVKAALKKVGVDLEPPVVNFSSTSPEPEPSPSTVP